MNENLEEAIAGNQERFEEGVVELSPEAAAKKEAAAPEDEFMIGQAIDPSSVPEDMLKYEE